MFLVCSSCDFALPNGVRFATVNLDGKAAGLWGLANVAALQVCRNTPGPSKRPGHENGRFVVDLRFTPFRPSGRSTSGLKFVCASLRSRRGTPKAQLARQMIRFKHPCLRVGRPDALLCDLKHGRTPRRVSSRVPTLQGLMQNKADRPSPTKPNACPACTLAKPVLTSLPTGRPDSNHDQIRTRPENRRQEHPSLSP